MSATPGRELSWNTMSGLQSFTNFVFDKFYYLETEMSPYKAIQVRLLRMSAERLSEKDKVHATISKDNPGIR